MPTAFNMTEDMSVEFASKVQCPHLVVKASHGPKYMSEEVYTRILDVFRIVLSNFDIDNIHRRLLQVPSPSATFTH